MAKSEPRSLTEDDVDTEVVPQTETAPPAVDEEELVPRILRDHDSWVAVADCLWLGQIAFRAGAKVSKSHPGLPQWIADQTVLPAARVETGGPIEA